MAHEYQRPQPARPQRLGYVPALDGVRALAALRVLLVHYLAPLAPLAATSPFPGFAGGRLGMQVFFTLSGFVVTVLLVEEFHRSGTIDLRTFWKRRLLRLMPALVFVLACLVLLGALVDTHIFPAGQGLRETPDSGTTTTWLPFWPGVAVVFFPISNWVEALRYASFRPLAVAWMPAVLDQFYLVWPFVLSLLLVRRRLSLRVCLVITLGLVGVATLWRTALVNIDNDFHAVTLRTDFNLAGIVLGCAGGLIFAAGMVPTDPRFRRVLGVAAWGSLAGILAIFAWGVQARADELVTLLGLLTVILVTDLAVDRTSRLSATLAWPPLVGIGHVSYGLYLWHWVWLQYPLAADRGTPLRLLIALALTAVSVLVSYYLIEMPALRLKERLAPRRGPGGATASATGNGQLRARRDVLPLVGMGTMMLVALSAYGLGTRYPSQLEVASVAAPPAPPATPHPRRSRQASRKRRHAERQSKTKNDAADAPRRSRGHATPRAEP